MTASRSAALVRHAQSGRRQASRPRPSPSAPASAASHPMAAPRSQAAVARAAAGRTGPASHQRTSHRAARPARCTTTVATLITNDEQILPDKEMQRQPARYPRLSDHARSVARHRLAVAAAAAIGDSSPILVLRLAVALGTRTQSKLVARAPVTLGALPEQLLACGHELSQMLVACIDGHWHRPLRR